MWFLQNTLTIRCQNSLPTRFISVHSRVEDSKNDLSPWSNQGVTDRFWSKTATFRAICNSRAKGFRLRIFFASKISKVNLGGPHGLNHREKRGPKRSKVVAWMAIVNISKMVFENQEAARSKIFKIHQKSKKFIEKWWFEPFEKKTYLQIYF